MALPLAILLSSLMTFGNLGWKSYENGDLDKAIEYREKALTFYNT